MGLWAILLLDVLWWGTRVAAGAAICLFLLFYLVYRLEAVLDYRHSKHIRERMTVRKVRSIEEKYSRMDTFSSPEKRALGRTGLDRYFYYVRYEQVQALLNRFALDASRVLDMGCGFGKNTMYVAEQLKIGAVGLDLDEVKLAWAAGEAAKRGISNRVELICADAAFPPLRSGAFDCIVMTEVLEHQLDPGQGIAACQDLLTDNGFLIITVPSRHNLAYSNNPFVLIEKAISLVDDRVLPCYHNLHAESQYKRRNPEPEYAIHYNFSCQTLERMLDEAGFRMVLRGSFEMEIFPYLLVELLFHGELERMRSCVAPLERIITRLPAVGRLGQHLVYVARKKA